MERQLVTAGYVVYARFDKPTIFTTHYNVVRVIRIQSHWSQNRP
jgi:hypothetical protein